MAITSKTYGNYWTSLIKQDANVVDFDADTIKAQLTDATHTNDPDTHDFLNDVSGDKTSGTTDQTLSNCDAAIDAGNDQVEVTCDNITFSSVPAGDAAGGIIVYKDTGTASTSRLIVACKFSSDVTPNGSDISVTINSEGIFKVAY